MMCTVLSEGIGPLASALPWSLGNNAVWPQNDLSKGVGPLPLHVNTAGVDTSPTE